LRAAGLTGYRPYIMSRPFVEEEAALSDDSDVDSSEDDGLDDDDALAKEGAGFIADEDDSEEEEEEENKPRKRRKKHKRPLELDDEDLNLLEENTVRNGGLLRKLLYPAVKYSTLSIFWLVSLPCSAWSGQLKVFAGKKD
jgi:Acidic N-terminal SPT6